MGTAPTSVRFHARGLGGLYAPKPLLWADADLSVVEPVRQEWYWHGTLTSKIPSILEHGLLPSNTQGRGHGVCLAARAHIALFFARMHLFYAEEADEGLALVAIPGRMLATKDLRIDQGCVYRQCYGYTLAHTRAVQFRNWRASEWKPFQAVFGCITTRQVLHVDPAWVTRVPTSGARESKDAIMNELHAGRPLRSSFFEGTA